MVVRKDLAVSSVTDLAGHTVAVPMRYSGHNLAMLEMAANAGIGDQIKIVEMNPPDMASALAAGSLDAYFVGEPFAAQTLKYGASKLFFYVEKIWPDFICNLLLVKQSYIDAYPERVQLLVEGAARSGIWALSHIPQAVQIASKYWGQPADVVEYALTTPKNRIVFNRFLPSEEELNKMAKMMVTFGLTEKDDVKGLVADRFAKRVDLTNIDDAGSVLKSPK
jgi:NitT/TauT family transport system substrate-binding protein